MKIIRSASLSPIRGRSIAILGYGAQGRAQALNLRDAGFEPTIGLPTKSLSRARARRDGFAPITPSGAVKAADIIFVLAPDHVHGKLYDRDMRDALRAGQTLVFAHASSVHFGLVNPPATTDVILIAPLGPGKRLRELRWRRDGVRCFFAIHHDASDRARATGLALARAIGCLPAGVISTTFAREAVGDLFGEQAVLCGGLSALLQAGVGTLVRHGFKPQTAYLECVYQLDLIVDLIKQEGLPGLFRHISPTAAFGAEVAGPKVISAGTRRAMDRLYVDITSGRFFRAWVKAAARRRGAGRGPRISAPYRRGEDDVIRSFGSHKARDE